MQFKCRLNLNRIQSFYEMKLKFFNQNGCRLTATVFAIIHKNLKANKIK